MLTNTGPPLRDATRGLTTGAITDVRNINALRRLFRLVRI